MKKGLFIIVLNSFALIFFGCSTENLSDSVWLASPSKTGHVLIKIQNDSMLLFDIHVSELNDTTFLRKHIFSVKLNSIGEFETGPDSHGVGGPYLLTSESTKVRFCYFKSNKKSCWDLNKLALNNPLIVKLKRQSFSHSKWKNE